MIILSFFLMLTMTISILLMFLALLFGKSSIKDREKLSPFECGFSAMKKARVPFSLRFFLVTILFLIFDVEVVLLLPLSQILNSSSLLPLVITSFTIIMILILGLMHEWNQSSLKWSD